MAEVRVWNPCPLLSSLIGSHVLHDIVEEVGCGSSVLDDRLVQFGELARKLCKKRQEGQSHLCAEEVAGRGASAPLPPSSQACESLMSTASHRVLALETISC